MSHIDLKHLSLTIFGESHSPMVGGVITGIPAGIPLPMESIMEDMKRRKPGQNRFSTQRKEEDIPRVVSGTVDDVTTGAPLCVLIENTSQHSKDYAGLKDCPRPSHADYTAFIKYNGFNDIRGGGHFSGRLTAPIVFLGSLCKHILQEKGVQINAHILELGGVSDQPLEAFLPELPKKDFPVIDDTAAKEMMAKIDAARDALDSVGGVIECSVFGMPAGFGGPLFEGVEGKLSSLLYGIPAVKGVAFGTGFGFANSQGSRVNDAFYMEDGQVKTYTNHNGGILGGITTGMPVNFKVCIKPTPSIYREQKTVNLKTGENTALSIEGRHDPCILVRAVPIVESIAAIAMLDYLLGETDGSKPA